MSLCHMASSPRDDPARLFALLPTYLQRRGVVAIGEVGFEPHSRSCPDLTRQEEWIRLQLQLSGDPRAATVEKGRAIWDAVFSNGVEFFETMRKFTGAHRD